MKRFGTKDVTFSNSKEMPFQRWYPYIEGYSPSFVEEIIDNYCSDATVIYEPFAGTGTTIFASDKKKKNTIYSEVNPMLVFLIQCKTNIMKMDENERILLSNELRDKGKTIFEQIKPLPPSQKLNTSYHKVFGKSVYFSKTEYNTILKLRKLIDIEYRNGNHFVADLISIAVLACLLPVSYLKKQGDVRFKTDIEREMDCKSMKDILQPKINEIADDVANIQIKLKKEHTFVTSNAKNIGRIDLDVKISTVITSPPYLNGTNYFRNTKVELWFLGYLSDETDLRKFRDEALTSGINDVKREYIKNKTMFKSDILDKTMIELQNKAYDTRIPLMAQCYFQEMYQMFYGLRNHLTDNADIMIDLGDSIFSNVHIKTDYILIQILEQLGYSFKERIVLRNRKSRNGEALSQVLIVLKYNQKHVKQNRYTMA